MKYVGIKNSNAKSKAIAYALKSGKVVSVSVESLVAPDCERHMEVLKIFDEGKRNVKDFYDTLYYKFNSGNGKDDTTIQTKLDKFYDVYQSIKDNGYKSKLGYIIITTDGARLDGSHRSSILFHLGHEQTSVIMVDWEDMLSKPASVAVRKHVQQQRKTYGLV